jgi:hypothetical protein
MVDDDDDDDDDGAVNFSLENGGNAASSSTSLIGCHSGRGFGITRHNNLVDGNDNDDGCRNNCGKRDGREAPVLGTGRQSQSQHHHPSHAQEEYEYVRQDQHTHKVLERRLCHVEQRLGQLEAEAAHTQIYIDYCGCTCRCQPPSSSPQKAQHIATKQHNKTRTWSISQSSQFQTPNIWSASSGRHLLKWVMFSSALIFCILLMVVVAVDHLQVGVLSITLRPAYKNVPFSLFGVPFSFSKGEDLLLGSR